ncbi:uncharacterized protein [Periplaneta americana]|uniref:uncharacterized protein n=1 Tax=Periplaneta americana TaxID=6978 RepID=UPI0037E84D26
MTTNYKLGMSLDEIIRLNRKSTASGAGSVVSRGTQQSRGRRGGRGRYQGRGRGRGRGGRFNQVSYRNQFGQYKRDFYGGRSPLLKRFGSTASLASRNQARYRGYRNFRGRGRGRYVGQQLARNRVRLATRLLNLRQMNRRQTSRFGYDGYRVLSGPRGFQMRRGLRTNNIMTGSFRSDQLVKLMQRQTVQQKLNHARALKAAQSLDKNTVTGSSDMLTVCISNDIAAKRRQRQRTTPFKKFGSVNSLIRGSFPRRGSNSYLSRQNVAALNRSSSVVDISPEGSIVTTISRYGRSSSVAHMPRAGSVGRVMQNRAQTIIEPYVPVTRNTLNVQLQKEIAAIQGKTFEQSTSSISIENGSGTGVGLSGFKPIPSLTGTTLHERFSSTV